MSQIWRAFSAYAGMLSQVGHFRRPGGTLLNCRDDFQGIGGTFFGHQPGHFYIDEHNLPIFILLPQRSHLGCLRKLEWCFG